MAVMRARSASLLIVAVVLAFGLTLALTWPRGEPGERSHAAAVSARAASAGTQTPLPVSAAPAPAPSPAPTTGPAARSQFPADEGAPGPEAIAPSLPVHLVFQSRRLNATPDPNHPAREMVVRLINSSHEALPVEVLVTSSVQAVKLQLQLVLQPHQSRELGAEEGATLESGDVITVKSPNFRDLVRPI
jgi:hypothetical protein